MTAFERSPCGTVCACGSIFARRPASAIISTIRAARDEAVLAVDGGDQPGVVVVALEPLEEVDIVLERDPALRVQDVDRPRALGLVALADLEVVEVVRGRDLDRARALLGIGIFVGDDRDQAADQRQPNLAADQMLIALVVGMDRDRGVAEHRLGPRRGDRHPLAGLLAVAVHHRIVEIVEMAVRDSWPATLASAAASSGAPSSRDHLNEPLHLDLDDLEIGDRGLELRVPVDQPLVLVDEPLAIELDEHLGDRARQALVEGEALAAPVAGGAEALELLNDRAARFRLPRPDPLEERLAAHGAPVRLLRAP